jgi:V/A-type H+-transporting ATPase subunit D
VTIKFQYNKTALQSLNKQLAVRLGALPTLKNKEAALRLEVKKAKAHTQVLEKALNEKIESYAGSAGLWNEFNSELITLGDVETSFKKIAGVKTPVMERVVFKEKMYSIFNQPKWFPEGISFIKEIAAMVTEKEFYIRKTILLDHARRKTTQKVNLY